MSGTAHNPDPNAQPTPPQLPQGGYQPHQQGYQQPGFQQPGAYSQLGYQQQQPWTPYQTPRKRGLPGWAIALIVIGVVFIGGVVALAFAAVSVFEGESNNGLTTWDENSDLEGISTPDDWRPELETEARAMGFEKLVRTNLCLWIHQNAKQRTNDYGDPYWETSTYTLYVEPVHLAWMKQLGVEDVSSLKEVHFAYLRHTFRMPTFPLFVQSFNGGKRIYPESSSDGVSLYASKVPLEKNDSQKDVASVFSFHFPESATALFVRIDHKTDISSLHGLSPTEVAVLQQLHRRAFFEDLTFTLPRGCLEISAKESLEQIQELAPEFYDQMESQYNQIRNAGAELRGFPKPRLDDETGLDGDYVQVLHFSADKLGENVRSLRKHHLKRFSREVVAGFEKRPDVSITSPLREDNEGSSASAMRMTVTVDGPTGLETVYTYFTFTDRSLYMFRASRKEYLSNDGRDSVVPSLQIIDDHATVDKGR